MKYNKYICFFDCNFPPAQHLYNALKKIFVNLLAVHFEEQNLLQVDELTLVLTLGGDGMMLKALHFFMGQNVDIYGINIGSIGFLLNEYDSNIFEHIQQSIKIQINPLKMIVTDIYDNKYERLAINEISLIRQTVQSAKIKVNINSHTRISELIGDGVMIATAVGSTAYNSAANGPILPITSNLMILTPINAFRPKKFSSVLLAHTTVIVFEVLELSKRPVNVAADSYEITNVKKVEIIQDQTIMSLLFTKQKSFEDKVLQEQFNY